MRESEERRLAETARAEAAELEAVLEQYRLLAHHLEVAWKRSAALSGGSGSAEPYRGQDTAGLPGYGFVDPEIGVYADFNGRADGSPWVSRPLVARARRDPGFRAALALTLHRAMSLSPEFREVAESQGGTVDLAWVVLLQGTSNAWPPYDYRALVEARPALAEVDENTEPYAQLADPAHNPSRREVWLEPYLDPFKRLWMTSCVLPLYEDGDFAGTVGIDVLMPMVTSRVRALRDGEGGYAFLIANSGRPIAIPVEGQADLVADPGLAAALRQTLLPAAGQEWSAELLDALGRTSLEAGATPEVAALIDEMREGGTGAWGVDLSGSRKIVAFAPVGRTGWSLGLVVPEDEVVARSEAVGAVIDEGARRAGRVLGALAALMVLGSAIVGFVLHYLMVLPVTRLSRQMASMDGVRLVAPPPLARDDEIGGLYARFRDLVVAIRSSRLELAREKDLLAVTVGSIADGVVAKDLDGRIVMLNDVAAALAGQPRARAVGRPLAELLPGLRMGDSDPAAMALRPGEVVRAREPVVLSGADGEDRFMVHTSAPIRTPSGEVVGAVVVLHDVTARPGSTGSKPFALADLARVVAGVAAGG